MNGTIFCLFNISHFSSINCLQVMSKRTQEDAGEERVTAKSKPMMNLVSRYSARDPNVLASTASESRGKTRSESQIPPSSWNEQQPRTGETCDGRWLIKPLRMEHWRQVVFSRVEIWWNVGSKNGETRGWTTVHPGHRQVRYRWRWYGLWHRHRIEPFAKVTVILAQGEWSIAKDTGLFFKRCSARHSTNVLYFGECLYLQHWKHLNSWERISHKIYIPSKIQGMITLWNRCLTYLKSW